MKDEINLLPPQVTAARTQRIFLGSISSLLTSVVVVAVLVVGAQVLAVVVNQELVKTIESHVSGRVDAGKNIQQRIARVNSTIALVDGAYQNTATWTPQVAQALEQVPAGVFVKSMIIEQTFNRLQLQGSAADRVSVIVLENRLRALPWVAKLDAPLQNFAASPATNFIFTLYRREASQ